MNILSNIRTMLANRKSAQLATLEGVAQKESLKSFIVDFKDGNAIIRFRGVLIFSNEDNSVVVETLRKLRECYVYDCMQQQTIL